MSKLAFSASLAWMPAYGLACTCAEPAAAPVDTAVVTFSGMCDASGAVAIDSRRFAVANDEDNVLRVYDAETGGGPLAQVDLSPDLPLGKKGEARKARKRAPELDLEAATRLGDDAFWLTSHGLNKKGKHKAARFVLFATSLPREGGAVRLVGTPYQMLLGDLLDAPSLAPFDLAAAAERPPKGPGGLNLEGLTATRDGRGLLIGFRNPVPRGRALLVPLSNPHGVTSGARAELGAPVLLDLGGMGVRSLSWWRGRFVVAAGAPEGGRVSRLFAWSGAPDAPPVREAELRDFNVEGFFTPEDRDDILVLSDDGTREVHGRPCKELDSERERTFRGLWLRIGASRSAARR